jgi:hypothetical protein
VITRLGALCAAIAAFIALTAAPAAAKTYPPGGPNDPDYAPAEQGNPVTTCANTSVNSEQHYLYSFEPQCAPNANDPGDASGMSVDKAWSTYTTGSPKTVIAYVEGGINWNDNP